MIDGERSVYVIDEEDFMGSESLYNMNQSRRFARILATITANTAAAHMKMNLQHYYKTLHGPKADPVELNLWTMIPMSTTARAMLDPEADKVDEQTDTAGLY